MCTTVILVPFLLAGVSSLTRFVLVHSFKCPSLCWDIKAAGPWSTRSHCVCYQEDRNGWWCSVSFSLLCTSHSQTSLFLVNLPTPVSPNNIILHRGSWRLLSKVISYPSNWPPEGVLVMCLINSIFNLDNYLIN